MKFCDLCLMQLHNYLLFYLRKGTFQLLNTVCPFPKVVLVKNTTTVSSSEEVNIHYRRNQKVRQTEKWFVQIKTERTGNKPLMFINLK